MPVEVDKKRVDNKSEEKDATGKTKQRDEPNRPKWKEKDNRLTDENERAVLKSQS